MPPGPAMVAMTSPRALAAPFDDRPPPRLDLFGAHRGVGGRRPLLLERHRLAERQCIAVVDQPLVAVHHRRVGAGDIARERLRPREQRSEEHTSELQSLMRISYAVFCLKKKKQYNSIY